MTQEEIQKVKDNISQYVCDLTMKGFPVAVKRDRYKSYEVYDVTPELFRHLIYKAIQETEIEEAKVE